jgi:hypothetical protein
MNEEKLRQLIEKYYKGESTDDEENSLRVFFTGDDIPVGFEAEKEIFTYYSAYGKTPETSTDFEARIIAGIDASENRRVLKSFRKIILPYMSIAAGLLIMIASYFFFIYHSESGDTFNDPKIAYAETMKILFEVSSQMNHSAQALEPVGKIKSVTAKSILTLDKSTSVIGRNIKNLELLRNAANTNNITDSNKRNK